MNGTSGDPVATISEADASGDIAAIYGDIRETLGVPVVNLIWRHLAVMPGGLRWAWDSLKPLYASGGIDAEADALRNTLELPALPGLSRPVLLAVGLDDSDIARITLILQSYERSNAMNMIALSALLARLEGTVAPSSPVAISATTASAVDGEMPPLLALDAMAPHVRDVVVALNTIGGRAEILASMYRHLANWPPYLGLIHTLLAPVEAEGRSEAVILGVIAEGRRRGNHVATGLAESAALPDAAVQAEMRDSISTFLAGPIGKMTTIVPLVSRAMPG